MDWLKAIVFLFAAGAGFNLAGAGLHAYYEHQDVKHAVQTNSIGWEALEPTCPQ